MARQLTLWLLALALGSRLQVGAAAFAGQGADLAAPSAGPPLSARPPRIGVYTGTFDPLHAGHIDKMDRAIEAMGLDRLIVLPNVKPRGKEHSQPFDVRWGMLAAVAAERPELLLPPKEVLAELMAGPDGQDRMIAWIREQYPSAAMIYRVMGTDSFARLLELDFDKSAIFGPNPTEAAVVLERPGYAQPRGRFPSNVHWVGGMSKAASFSSTEIRRNPLLREAQVPRPVALEIKSRGLYGRTAERGFYDLPRFLAEWLTLEQSLNDRIEDLSEFDSIRENGLDPNYLPESRPVFPIETVEVPWEKARVIAAEPLPEQIVFEREGRRFVRFFVHPESRPFFQERLKGYPGKKEYLATPTSSHRSLVVWNPKTQDPPLGIKVSLNVKIGGSARLVTRKQIERATAVSALLKTIPEPELSRRGIVFMDEPGGVILDGFEYGFNLRRLPDSLEPGSRLVPMFSLYSKPIRGPPLIVRLARESGLDIREFVRRNIIEPMVAQAAYLAFKHGLVGELHEQNVLVELRGGRLSGRFWYRDLSGFYINRGLRCAVGKDMGFLPEGISAESLKAERADLVDQLESYLRRSNLFALHEAFAPYAPEVTAGWLDQAFRDALSEAVERETGLRARSLAALRRAVARRANRPGS